MEIKDFIEKAIEGGWMSNYEIDDSAKPVCGNVVLAHKNKKGTMDEFHSIEFTNEKILLDPEAWVSVGKVEDWNDVTFLTKNSINPIVRGYERMAEVKMKQMIDSLWREKSLEEYIKSL